MEGSSGTAADGDDDGRPALLCLDALALQHVLAAAKPLGGLRRSCRLLRDLHDGWLEELTVRDVPWGRTAAPATLPPRAFARLVERILRLQRGPLPPAPPASAVPLAGGGGANPPPPAAPDSSSQPGHPTASALPTSAARRVARDGVTSPSRNRSSSAVAASAAAAAAASATGGHAAAPPVRTPAARLHVLRIGPPVATHDLDVLLAPFGTSLDRLELNGQGLHSLAPIAAAPCAPHLRALTVHNLSLLDLADGPAPRAAFRSLAHLCLRGCRDPCLDIAGLCCRTLTSLDLSRCHGVCNVAPLARLTALRSVNLRRCTAVEDVGPLASLPHLEELNLEGCAELETILPPATAPATCFTALRTLTLSYTDTVRLPGQGGDHDKGSGAGASSAPSGSVTAAMRFGAALEHLDLSHMRQLESLAPLSMYVALLWLSISGTDVASLAPLRACVRLRHLDVGGCRSLTTLAPLEGCTRLEVLRAGGCVGLRDVRVLTALGGSLTELDLGGPDVWLSVRGLAREQQGVGGSGGRLAVDLRPLSACTRLQSLRLARNSSLHLQDVSLLAPCVALERLDLRGCPQLRDVSALAEGLPRLRYVNLMGCDSLGRADVEALKARARASGRVGEGQGHGGGRGGGLELELPEQLRD